MAIPKVMGIETEYGITVKNQPDFNPILSSLLLINSYETYRSSRIRWDYEAESPLRDARGFEYMEEKDGPSKEESRLINLDPVQRRPLLRGPRPPRVLEPGDDQSARPASSGTGPASASSNLARQRAEAVSPPEQRILIHKNNTDRQGQLLRHPRELPDGPQGALRAHRAAHDAVLRHPPDLHGRRARSGARTTPRPCDYQISQRADFLETEVGLETMHSRPIVNTRDEPHADPEKYRRLHVIVGDANMAEVLQRTSRWGPWPSCSVDGGGRRHRAPTSVARRAGGRLSQRCRAI